MFGELDWKKVIYGVTTTTIRNEQTALLEDWQTDWQIIIFIRHYKIFNVLHLKSQKIILQKRYILILRRNKIE